MDKTTIQTIALVILTVITAIELIRLRRPRPEKVPSKTRKYDNSLSKDDEAGKNNIWLTVTSTDKHFFQPDGVKYKFSRGLPVSELSDDKIESVFAELRAEIEESIRVDYKKSNTAK